MRITLCALAALVLAAGCRHSPTAVANPTLTEWITSASRPEFSLLDQAELEDYYVCVFDSGKAEVVLFYFWKHAEGKPDTHSLMVADSTGRNLQDKDRWGRAPVYQHGRNGEFFDGMVVPVAASHEGKIHVELLASTGPGYNPRPVYEARVGPLQPHPIR